MVKRIFIVHGWYGTPKEGWFPWLKKELELLGYKAIILKMPNKNKPMMVEWINHLKLKVGTPDKDTYLVGHSIGCQTILRYLAQLPEKTQIGGAVFVAGWIHLKNLSTEEIPIAKPWLTTKINYRHVKLHTKNFVAIFSDNDPYVPLSDVKIFSKELKAKTVIDHNKGHYSEEHGVMKNPKALKELMNMLKHS